MGSLKCTSESSINPGYIKFAGSSAAAVSFSSQRLLVELTYPSYEGPVINAEPVIFPSLFRFLVGSLISFAIFIAYVIFSFWGGVEE